MNRVRAGHGLVVLSGYGGGNDAYTDSLLGPFGLTYGSGYSGNDIVVPIPGHPVVDGVSGLGFYGGRHVTASPDASVPFASLGGSPIGVATPYEKGRVVMYGDEWILLDVEVNRVDDAGAKPTHAFWHNVLLWSGGRL